MTTTLKRWPGFTRFAACFVLIAFSAACTTMRPVQGSDATAFAAEIEVGDKVRITRSDFSTVEFEVSNISHDGIGRDGVFVAWSDVQQVEIEKIHAAKTGAVVVLSAVAIGLAVILASGPDFGPITLGGPSP